MTSIAESLFDATVRAENIIWIPGALADPESAPDIFSDEFCDWLPEKPDHPLYKSLPALARFGEGDYPAPEDVADALLNTPGFLVQAATPVMKHRGGCSQYTWGHYRICWLYAPTEADIPAALLQWAESCRELERSKDRSEP